MAGQMEVLPRSMQCYRGEDGRGGTEWPIASEMESFDYSPHNLTIIYTRACILLVSV